MACTHLILHDNSKRGDCDGAAQFFFGDNDPGIQSITFDAGYPDDTRDKFTVKATAKRSEEHTKGEKGRGEGSGKEAGSMRPTKRKTDGAGSLQGPEAGCPEHLPRSVRVSLPGGLDPQAPPPPHPEMALALGVYKLEKSIGSLDTLEALTSRTSLVLGGHQYELEDPEEDEGQTAVLSRSDMDSKWRLTLTYQGGDRYDAVDGRVVAVTRSAVAPTQSPCGAKFHFCSILGFAAKKNKCKLEVGEVEAQTSSGRSPRHRKKATRISTKKEIFMDELKASKTGALYAFAPELFDAENDLDPGAFAGPWGKGVDIKPQGGKEERAFIKKLPFLGDDSKYQAVLVSEYDCSTGVVSFAANVREVPPGKKNKKTFARKYEIDVDRYFGGEFDSDFEGEDGSPLAAKSTTAHSVVDLMSAGIVGAAHARK